MERILSIAKEITNPYSLTALFFLILFILYKSIINKIGEQKGTNGYLIIKRLMGLIALIAVITLFLVFGLKTYEVYSKVDEVPKIDLLSKEINKSTENITDTLKKQIIISNKIINTNVNDVKKVVAEKVIKELSAPRLEVEHSFNLYQGASLLIGNVGDNIIIVKNLTIHWAYQECSLYTEERQGGLITEFRYLAKFSKHKNAELLESKELKYGKGDIDKFNIKIDYLDLGKYSVWFTFDYKIFGTKNWNEYGDTLGDIEVCQK